MSFYFGGTGQICLQFLSCGKKLEVSFASFDSYERESHMNIQTILQYIVRPNSIRIIKSIFSYIHNFPSMMLLHNPQYGKDYHILIY